MEQVRQNLTEGQAIDLFVAYRFLRILTTPWEDQEAYKLGIIDKDGKLFYEMVKVLKKKKPRFFIVENVKGLISANRGQAFPLIIKSFEDI